MAARVARRWPGPTPRGGSPTRSWRRLDEREQRSHVSPYADGNATATDWAGRRLHFIGIGGAGMSGLALVCARLGATVTGSDRADSSYMERLRAAGLEPASATTPPTCPRAPRWSSRPRSATTTPSWRWPASAGVEPIHRGALLAELCAEKRLIAVAGTHGKTTTTAMAVWALRAIGADPAFFVGGEVPGSGADGARRQRRLGRGRVGRRRGRRERRQLPRAASPRSRWSPTSRWTTTPAGARWPSCTTPSRELPRAGRRRASLASADGWLGRARRRGRQRRSCASTPTRPGRPTSPLAVPGRHNRANARAALAALELAGLDVEAAAAALADFPGVRRRLELKGERDGARIYDDYAHHPTEVRAALSALRELEPERLIAVFQPHLYSRTKAFAEEFGAALALADEVVVLDVYPAREEPVGELAGVSGLRVAQAAAERMGGRPVWWLPDAATARRAAARAPGSRPAAGLDPGHDRRRRHLQARRGAGWREDRMSAPPAGRRARLPARPPDHGPHRRRRRLVRPPGDRGGAGRAAAPGPRRRAWR